MNTEVHHPLELSHINVQQGQAFDRDRNRINIDVISKKWFASVSGNLLTLPSGWKARETRSSTKNRIFTVTDNYGDLRARVLFATVRVFDDNQPVLCGRLVILNRYVIKPAAGTDNACFIMDNKMSTSARITRSVSVKEKLVAFLNKNFPHHTDPFAYW